MWPLQLILYVYFWKSYIKSPMVLVGPSLGAAVAIDSSVNYPEALHAQDSFVVYIYLVLQTTE